MAVEVVVGDLVLDGVEGVGDWEGVAGMRLGVVALRLLVDMPWR
jgi:hypothetical protein